MPKENENGTRFELAVKNVIRNVFVENDPLGIFTDNIQEIDGKDFVRIQDGAYFKQHLELRSYLVKQPRYRKGTGKEGRADWAWYSKRHPDGIMIECVSQDVPGSKEGRLTADVRNSVHYFTQKHKILVLGGERRFLLKKDAVELLKEERRIARRVAPNSHIVTIDDLDTLLKTV